MSRDFNHYVLIHTMILMLVNLVKVEWSFFY